MRDDVLAFEARRNLHKLIREHPGLHLRELERVSDMNLSTLRYHIDYLVKHRLVDVEQDKYYRRFFERRGPAGAERRILSALRQRALRRIVLHCLEAGDPVPYQDLRSLGVPASTLAVHLSELTRRGILERISYGRESAYRLADADQVRHLIFAYRSSFLDAIIDHLYEAIYQEADNE